MHIHVYQRLGKSDYIIISISLQNSSISFKTVERFGKIQTGCRENYARSVKVVYFMCLDKKFQGVEAGWGGGR